MRRIPTRLVVPATIALLGLTAAPAAGGQAAGPAQRAAAGSEAYFEFDYPPGPERFIFRLTDPDKIREARDILSGSERHKTHVLGKIVKSTAPYNPGWNYHLDPQSISFFAYAIEVCDATPWYVQNHLDEVGGAFLPGAHWCPWGSRLLREVPAP
ncbi:hypothetical protein SAMN04489712_104487 [Thermomonospora echinospora]|uniref:BP74 N-terminal domain-containing protein n=1 Tax=Thermomonospora echinospora TaxID=1992 RepID=A0A1H5ZDN8_9ACTN|nr:calmodulin-binding protein [Thermomonospora echinospora]SEG34180.1 hypothetical protein SAMN04489712_104487 [Thermomonospora echinospora]